MRSKQTNGTVAQVVAKGIWGATRRSFVKKTIHYFQEHQLSLTVRMAGSSSFEFNRQGVDKSLCIRFLYEHFNACLDQIGYTPGDFIDARKTLSCIAFDGDGTIFDGPRVDFLPTLEGSPAQLPINNLLASGIVLVLISGNDLNRTLTRIKAGVPAHLYHRLMVSANGGADLVGIDKVGQPILINDYRSMALSANKHQYELDIVYIGDDSAALGNDMVAFQTVGYDRSVCVAPKLFDDTPVGLHQGWIGGNITSTAMYLRLLYEQLAFKKTHQIYPIHSTIVASMKKFHG
jgi:hypothetical protein